ncbi:MAG TPA: VWA domain-containing protein [Bryobacteraceae bacterium]|nr:VWA domain-containing protein [Bryobacteraceae bacterium]
MRRALPLLLAFGLLARAQNETTLRSQTREVVVDVVVRDSHGQYVRDLSARDFRIWEDNHEQQIASIERAKTGGASADSYLILLFDDAHSDAAEQHYARQAAAKLIEGAAGPGRLTAVAHFGSRFTVSRNFTSDAPSLLAALNGATTTPRTGAGSAYEPQSVLMALRSIARDVADLPGRKLIAFLSPGFRLTSGLESDLASAVDACNRADVAVYPIDIEGLSRDSPRNPGFSAPAFSGRIPLQGTPEAVVTPTTISERQQVLRALATRTGGFFVVNTNDLPGGLARIAHEGSEYYLVSYTPSRTDEPGTCHSIRVKVDLPAEVRARSGYCEQKPLNALAGADAERDLEREFQNQSLTAAPMRAVYFYLSANLVRVHATIDLPARAFRIVKDRGHFRAEANLLGIARSPDGAVAARFGDTVAVDLEDSSKVNEFLSKPWRYEKQFKLPCGDHTIEVVFGAGENFGKASTALAIDPWDGKRLQLSSLALGKAAATDLNSDDTAKLLTDDGAPLIANNVRVLPAATNRFSKTDELLVYGETYGESVRSARIELLNAATNAVESALGTVALHAGGRVGAGFPFDFKLRLESLTPGPHRLLVVAADSSGAGAGRSVDFEVY